MLSLKIRYFASLFETEMAHFFGLICTTSLLKLVKPVQLKWGKGCAFWKSNSTLPSVENLSLLRALLATKVIHNHKLLLLR